MKKLKAYGIAAAGLGVLVLLLVLTGSGRAVAQAFGQVKVINTHSEAVPVCSVCEPQPFQQHIAVSIPEGAREISVPVIAVPAGKRAVLEQFSVVIEPRSRRFEPMLLEVVVDGTPQSFHSITMDERTKQTVANLVFGTAAETGETVELRFLINGHSSGELSPVKIVGVVEVKLSATPSAP